MSHARTTWAWATIRSGDYELDTAARVVLLSLSDRANGRSGDCWPSYARIAADTGLSRASVARALRHLKAQKIIDWSPARAGSRTAPNRYRFRGGPLLGSVPQAHLRSVPK